jgi:branched-chain amino acid transport system ATP-binding protein
MAEPLLSVRGLRKAYGAVIASDGLELEIAAGEIHAVIGPNGAGKSTLVGQIAGEVRPDAGSIHLLGEDVTGLPVHARAARGLARSFQITSLLPHFTALDNVALAVQAHRGHSFRFWRPAAAESGLRDAALAALERVGLAGRAAVPAAALAHGEQRQLELAVALAAEPKLLLLDEPTAGTGREDTARIVELLAALRGRSHDASHGAPGILLVEHDMDAVFALADRITVLVYGRVIASGRPDAIRADPEVRRAYLGEDETIVPEGAR